MLKVIVFKNFVHFKDKTFIPLDVSKRGKAGKSIVGGNPTTDNNFLNIFVGANFSGKSTVLELIRRCMTEEINASVTSSCDDNLVAYAFCKFDMDPDPNIISGIIKDPKTNKVFKIIFSSKTLDVIVYSSSLLDIRNFYRCQPPVDADIQAVLNEEDDECSVNRLLKTITDACRENNKVKKKVIKKTLDSIEDKYVTTFPLRGIGSLQWSKSKKIAKDQRTKNYSTAYERAEIISELLSKNQKKFINAVEENRVFKYLTDLEDFKLDKETGTITVTRNGNTKAFPLLKISEGILEAKSTSLLLAHTQFKTLCLEDPDRGMHPQMIERLKSVLYDSGFNKTIIVVTHSPYFIDNLTIDKTHMFFRTNDEPSVCTILNMGQSEELQNVADIETKRTLLFATRVLLVEGATDQEVVQGILTENKCQKLEKRKSQKDFTDISIHQIISVRGKSNVPRVQRFCNFISLPCLSLLDLDAVNTGEITQFKGYGEDLKNMYENAITEKKFEQFLKNLESQLKVFVWRDGALEDAILSSKDRNAEIAKELGETGLHSTSLKTILKEPIDGSKRKGFYTELMKVDEIKRFIKFIEDNTPTI